MAHRVSIVDGGEGRFFLLGKNSRSDFYVAHRWVQL